MRQLGFKVTAEKPPSDRSGAVWSRNLRAKRAKYGLCPYCGKTPPETGKKRCRQCLDKHTGEVKRRAAARKADGLCSDCRAPTNGTSRCGACNRGNAAHLRARAKARAYDGICTNCRRKTDDGKKLCLVCRNKHRASDTQRKYGITMETLQSMIENQHGLCKLCGGPPRARSLAVDHDHETGAVRGLLCGPCNTGIGHLRESPELLRAAAKYIEDARGVLPISA